MCITCKDYEVSSLDKKECVEKKCEKKNEFVTKDGECKECPSYELASKDGKGCERPKCKCGEVL